MVVLNQPAHEGSSESKGKLLIAAVSEESNANSRINLTPKTWIARPLSEPGKGPCPSGGCKHMRLAHNPISGRIYFLGGDYGGPGAMASARNELFSYSIKENNWNLEYPYCGPAGDIQPIIRMKWVGYMTLAERFSENYLDFCGVDIRINARRE